MYVCVCGRVCVYVCVGVCVCVGVLYCDKMGHNPDMVQVDIYVEPSPVLQYSASLSRGLIR